MNEWEHVRGQPIAEVLLRSGRVSGNGHDEYGKRVAGRDDKDDRGGRLGADETQIGIAQRTCSRGRQAMRRRAEIFERSFAHDLNRGGMRRTWLRGRENVHKRSSLTGHPQSPPWCDPRSEPVEQASHG
jgi:hypothetical protein